MVITGGSVRCTDPTQYFQGVGDTAWGSTDFSKEENKVTMVSIDLSEELKRNNIAEGRRSPVWPGSRKRGSTSWDVPFLSLYCKVTDICFSVALLGSQREGDPQPTGEETSETVDDGSGHITTVLPSNAGAVRLTMVSKQYADETSAPGAEW
mgnify:CR=1 FL=1